ncbi:MAG TPA: thiaminase II [Thermodesulfobacteriota bacterium]|nr:thiaminase II [Thermodesulfobacteriota bacterium]
MKFTESLWVSIENVYGRILKHPFIRGLIDGSLDEEAFRFYVIQDAFYLRDYARGLALLGTKSPRDPWMMMFLEHARDVIVVERSLHESFFKAWHLEEKEVDSTPLSPTNLFYTSYLLRVAYERPFPEVLGCFLPCYWIYWEVGKELEKVGSPNELFHRWIQAYSSEAYGAIVQQVLEVMDQVARGTGEDDLQRIRSHFIITSKLEYLFWDMGFQRQTWGI